MPFSNPLSRRSLLRSAAILLAGPYVDRTMGGIAPSYAQTPRSPAPPYQLMNEYSYANVQLGDCNCETQFQQTQAVLLQISDDSMLMPLRRRAGLPTPGIDLGGWYAENPNYRGGDGPGFAPGHCFGQWLSALARGYAVTGSPATASKIRRLLDGYSQTVTAAQFQDMRFPAYTYDKLVCGLIDTYKYTGDRRALEILDATTQAALPNLPDRAYERGPALQAYRGKDETYSWDETYTLPENLFLAASVGAGNQYMELAKRFLLDSYFKALADGKNVLPGKHAYSYVNALSSAMAAYLAMDSEEHLLAAKNAFSMIQNTQSFVTGGWGPGETFVEPDTGALGASLEKEHRSFETPCGAYAHTKLCRYLLCVTGDAKYGDSMESIIYNTVLGAKPLQADGSAFYYSDYAFAGHKIFFEMKCPCCAGTLPQMAADYRINTYFHDAKGVFVNLYLPSTLKCDLLGNSLTVTQNTEYPFEGLIRIEVSPARPAEFDVRLRIPNWAINDVSVTVNGARLANAFHPGTFPTIHRRWSAGDTIELSLPLPLRLEPVDAQNPNVVALLSGPLVLFAVTDKLAKVSRAQLLAAKREQNNSRSWTVNTADGDLVFKPFTEIGDEQYSTYLRVT